MDLIKAFENNNNTSHVTIRGTHEEPLLRASDIGEVLGMTNIRQSIQDFDNTEKRGVSITDAIGRIQETTFLTEKGLYKLVFKSRKPIAKQFTDWVCEVIKEIRLKGKYELEQQLQDLAAKTEENLALNSSQKKLVYLGTVDDDEDDVKFGQSKDVENRVINAHKKDFPNFVLKYTIHSEFHIELEEAIKLACKDKKSILYNRRISKVYNGKKQTEIIKLDAEFTIEDLYNEIKKINKKLIDKKSFGSLTDEIENLKNEIENLKNENESLKYTIANISLLRQSDQPKYKTSINLEEKYVYLFLEDFLKIDSSNVVKISNKEFYEKYQNFVKDKNEDGYIVTNYKFGVLILGCPDITTIAISNKINKETSEKEKIMGKSIVTSKVKEWVSNKLKDDDTITQLEENIQTVKQTINQPVNQTVSQNISKNMNNYQIQNLINFLTDLISSSTEEILIYQNQVLFEAYKKYNIKSDFSLSQFGLYLLKIPGIIKFKSSKIWSKQINCKLVKCWLNTTEQQ